MAQTKRATTASERASKRRGRQRDKLAKAEMSREMLAAGLAAAAAAISSSPKARQKIRIAGIEAADNAQAAASTMVSSASKLGSLIAEAVADAAQRVMSGKWADVDSKTHRQAKPRAGRKIHVTITEGIKVSENVEAQLVGQVEAMIAQSGGPEDFDASKWVHDWIRHEVPALDGKRPIDLLDSPEGRERVSTTLAQMQSGAYA